MVWDVQHSKNGVPHLERKTPWPYVNHYLWQRPFPAPIMLWASAITQTISTLLAAYGFGLITPISWSDTGLVWAYSITSAFVTDVVKVEVYRHLAHQTSRHRRFLKHLTRALVHHHQVRH